MNKEIPSGYLGLPDTILRYAHILQPDLWGDLNEREARIWRRLVESVDGSRHLEQLLEIEFERTHALEVFERKDSFWQALAGVRGWLHDGTISAHLVGLNWHLIANVIHLYEMPHSLKQDFWLNDERANTALLSGVISPSPNSTHAGDLLILLPELHVNMMFDLQRRVDTYAGNDPDDAFEKAPVDPCEQQLTAGAPGSEVNQSSLIARGKTSGAARRKRPLGKQAVFIEALSSLYPDGDPVQKGMHRETLRSAVADKLGVPITKVDKGTLDRARKTAWC